MAGDRRPGTNAINFGDVKNGAIGIGIFRQDFGVGFEVGNK